MKTTTKLTSLMLGGILVTALAVPVLGQRNRDRSGDMEENSWRAAPGQQDGNARERRGPGARRDGERPAFAPRGPEGPRGPQGPGGPGGPGGFGGPGIDGALARATALMIPFWENDDVVEKLGLTDSQIQSLAESHSVTKESLEAGEGSVREAAEALREEMERDNPDLTTVNDLVDTVTEASNEKSKLILGHAVVVKNVLTEEQEELLKDHARGAREEHGPEARRLMQEAREIVQGGGTLDDVIALIEGSELPDNAKDRLIKMAEQRAAKKSSK